MGLGCGDVYVLILVHDSVKRSVLTVLPGVCWLAFCCVDGIWVACLWVWGSVIEQVLCLVHYSWFWYLILLLSVDSLAEVQFSNLLLQCTSQNFQSGWIMDLC